MATGAAGRTAAERGSGATGCRHARGGGPARRSGRALRCSPGWRSPAAACLRCATCRRPPPARQARRPDPPAPTPEAAEVADGSLVAFYAGVEGDLTASGRMRRETAPKDAPYTVEDLARNFERIALYDEYVDLGGRFVRSETPAFLRRWNRPVRVGVMTGPSVPEEETARATGRTSPPSPAASPG